MVSLMVAWTRDCTCVSWLSDSTPRRRSRGSASLELVVGVEIVVGDCPRGRRHFGQWAERRLQLLELCL